MFTIIFIAILIYFAIFIIKNKIHFKIKTFFKKGFKKTDNKFGLVVFTR